MGVLDSYLLSLVNAERAKTGAGALTFDGELMSAAQGHTDWMATNAKLSHTGAGGSSPFDRAKSAGYDYTSAAENVAMASDRGASGFDKADVDVMHQNLMNSAGHRQNILNPDLKEVGFGFSMKNGSGYITELFGTPTRSEAGESDKGGGSAPPAPAPLPVPKPVPVVKAEIKGTAGNDFLKGTAGNDIIVGGKGHDMLIGGAGKDTFVYTLKDGGDTIRDFKPGLDMIELRGIKAGDVNMYDTAKGLVIEVDTGAGADVTLVTLTGIHDDLGAGSFVHA